MGVKKCWVIATCAILVGNIVQAAGGESTYVQAPYAASTPRVRSANEPPRPEYQELANSLSTRAKQNAARSTHSESVLAASAEMEAVESEGPELQPVRRQGHPTAARTNRSAAARPLPSQRAQRSNGSASPASYNASKYAPSYAGRPTQQASTGSVQSRAASERYWQENNDRGGLPASVAASFGTSRQGNAGGEEIISGDDSYDFGGPTCDDCCGPKWSPCYNCCGWFGGADYLLLRPTFSENTAYVRRTVELDEEENLTTTDTVVPRDFVYSSGLRGFLGYRFGDCGGELRFTYWYFDTSTNQVTPRAPADGSEIFIGQIESVTQQPGQRLLIDNNLHFNLYDIEYAKCICFNDCNPCCQPWSLKYYVGARIADIRRQDNGLVQNRDDSLARAWFINGDFIGAGPRVGLEGRRLFGEGRFSLFARTNFSLLLGGWDLGETRQTPANNPTVTENYFDSHTRLIPVGEIELGGNYQISRSMSIGAGYMFQAWWDLGAFEQIQGNVFLSPVDDSNIMGLDGLFARFELCF